MSTQTIQVDTQEIINLSNTILPLLEKFFPAVQSNDDNIKLGLSAAKSLSSLLSLIPSGSGLITPEEQQAQLSRVNAILDGSLLAGDEWKIQT